MMDVYDLTVECIHGMSPVETCTLCNGRGATLERECRVVRVLFPARFPGRCNHCHQVIEPGDKIGRTPDDGYACKDCAIVLPGGAS